MHQIVSPAAKEGLETPRKREVLVVEDDAAVRAAISTYLEQDGFRVTHAETAGEMFAILARQRIDLILLDLLLPDGNALELIGRLRTIPGLGIIVITARREDIDRIIGIELGADDYLVKPVNLRELAARVRNVLRRLGEAAVSTGSTAASPQICRFDGWTLDLARCRLTAPDGRDIRLTRSEFDLLVALASRPGQTMDRYTLIETVTSRSANAEDRTIDVLIARLRRKIRKKIPRTRT